jgi:rsbT co-antagonist protein RsbR
VTASDQSGFSELLRQHETDILEDWVKAQVSGVGRTELLDANQLRRESREFLALLRTATHNGQLDDMTTAAWDDTRRMLSDLSQSRARLGFTPAQTATFIFSLKEPIFARIRNDYGTNPQAFAAAISAATRVLDRLGLYTTEVYQKGREEVISRQQQEMLELSTPVVELWDGVLALPLIGTLDSARTQVVMESLLQRIVETGSGIAIIDITGVPTVDTLVAQHLLKTVAAARLMGADCIISGIRPQIAQTIVHLGVDLQDVVTKATLADAFAVALKRLGLAVQKPNGHAAAAQKRANRATEKA